LEQLNENLIRRSRQKLETPENVPRLYDLVEPKAEHFRPAFYHALRDTLVVKDLAQATRVSTAGRQRYRSVTLKGEVVDVSGTLSGGGHHVSRGGMSSRLHDDSVTPESIAQHEKQILSFQEETSKVGQSIEDYRKRINELNNELSKCTLTLKKHEMEIHAKTQQIQETELLLSKIKNITISAEDAARQAELENSAKVLQPVLKKTKAIVSKYTESVDLLKKKILDISGPKLKSQSLKVETITKELDTLATAITRTNVSVKANIKKKKTMEDKIESLLGEIDSNKKFIETTKKEFEELDEKAQKVLETIKVANELYEAKKREIEQNDIHYNTLKKEATNNRSLLVDLANNVDHLAADIKTRREHIKYWTEMLKKLELLPFPSFVKEPPQNYHELKEYDLEEIKQFNKEELEYKVTILDEEVKKMNPNMSVLAEYAQKCQEYEAKKRDYETASQLRDTARAELARLKKERLTIFLDGFSKIALKLKEMYQMITMGGDAELEQVNSLDPFEDGIVFSVRPPKKSWKNISNLSGGEKVTLRRRSFFSGAFLTLFFTCRL
jgi:structural maintenance of chromosome 4